MEGDAEKRSSKEGRNRVLALPLKAKVHLKRTEYGVSTQLLPLKNNNDEKAWVPPDVLYPSSVREVQEKEWTLG